MGRGKQVLWLVMIMLAVVCAANAQETMGSGATAETQTSQIVAGGVVGQVASLTGEVVAIDYTKREATLKLTDGTEKKIAVSEAAYNFDQVKVGDIVNIEVGESVALFVDRMPSEPNASAETVLARAPKGQKPEGVAVSYVDATATVTDIDYVKRTISLVGPEGNTLTMNVPVDAAPNFDKIKKGDTVALRYTVALAVKVEPAGKKSE
jgi:hypothetical protein